MPAAEQDSSHSPECLEANRHGSTFARQVHDVLAHLYDPFYLQTHPFSRRLRDKGYLKGTSLGQALRQEILSAIEELGRQTEGPAPSDCRGQRLLTLRYGEAMSAAEVQRCLAIGRSQFYREHRRALEALVSLLTQRWSLGEPAAGSRPETVEAKRPNAMPQNEPTASLTLALTSFIGRQQEMAEVRRLLGQTRLLTLTGSGGCGKTRLALQVASDVAAQYPDGVTVVQLAALADPGLVSQTVAHTIGVQAQYGQDVTPKLVRYLQPREAMLILDNCEHVLEPCADLVETLLGHCPKLRVLVTSREALGISGETRWRVPSLSAPPPESWTGGPGEASKFEAVQLFVERARAVRPNFELTVENARAVAEVCWRLDGIPLAVELAAARARVLAVQQIAERLDDRFRFLTGGSRTALARHKTLRATIDWSYDLIDTRAQILFRRLSVFLGGWTLEAAEAVCADWPQTTELARSNVSSGEVLDLLAQLVDRSLVWVEVAPEQARYRFLETIRQFAAEKLSQVGEAEEAQRRHCEWFVAFAERELPKMVGPQQRHCLPRLEAEHANFLAALAWCQREPTGAEPELRLVAVLARYWRWIGRWTEAATWLDDALARCGQVDSVARARALTTRGLIEVLYIGDIDLALALAEEGVAVARVGGDQQLLAHSLRQAGEVHVCRGDHDTALSRFDEALAVARQAGDEREACSAFYQRALMCYDPRDLATIVRTLEQTLTVARSLGDTILITEILMFLGGVLTAAREYDRAAIVLAEARASAWSAHYEFVGWITVVLGDSAYLRGNFGEASKWYAEALEKELERGSEGLGDEVLARVAALGAAEEDYGASARLFAWCAAEHRTTWVRWVFDRLGASEMNAANERALAATRERLGEEALTSAWEAGRSMTLREAGELGKAVLKVLQADWQDG